MNNFNIIYIYDNKLYFLLNSYLRRVSILSALRRVSILSALRRVSILSAFMLSNVVSCHDKSSSGDEVRDGWSTDRLTDF